MMSGYVMGLRITHQPQMQMLAICILLVFPSFGLTQHTDEPYVVEPTPALRLGDEELTTVLFVTNDNRTAAHGRYLNVRPNLGLLTSTARTFIQEGITTEYATQVLGTTLENGRIYAQLLKKSSRVLYDKENVIAPSATNGGAVHTSIIGEEPDQVFYHQPRSLLQSHNDLVADKDWQDVDDRIILEKNSFVGNTDFVGPRQSLIVFPIKEVNKNSNEETHKMKSFNQSPPVVTVDIAKSTDVVRIMANKIQPAIDLSTYTIMNMFSPSGFSWESSPENDTQKNKQTFSKNILSEQRSPKLLYHQVMKEEPRALSTITYYGFADFTTIVGDSVIVFSPSTTVEKVILGQVTSIKGKATLGRQDVSYVSQVPITITQDLIEPTFVIPMLPTDVNDLRVMPTDMREKNKKESNTFKPDYEEANIEITTVSEKEQHVAAIISDPSPYDEVEDFQEQPVQKKKTVSSQNKKTLLKNYSSNSPTEEDKGVYEKELGNQVEQIALVSSMSDLDSTTSENIDSKSENPSRVMLSRPSDEEILLIYSSLAKAEAAQKESDTSKRILSSTVIEAVTLTESSRETIREKGIPIKEETTSTDASSTKTKTTSTYKDQIQSDIQIKGGATTIFFEDDPFLKFVSPSSTETKIFQQTDSIEIPELESEQSSTSKANIFEDEVVTESVTESETETLVEETTFLPEIEKEDNNESEEVPEEHENFKIDFKPIIKEIEENEEIANCVRTSQVYLTQVPKTLTYYTTFFIPNTNSETSTSIETNVVPSFDISQATKHYCIQPTPIINYIAPSSNVPVLERPLDAKEANANENDSSIKENDDDSLELTTPMIIVRENAEVTEAEIFDASGDGYEEEENSQKEEDEDDEEEEEQDSGEEIELIYKTLYTTYTYLTTFFHDSTISISSHKEVVTNIITSSMSLESIVSTEDVDIEPTAKKVSEAQATPTLSKDTIRLTAQFDLQSSDLIKIDGILRENRQTDTKKSTEQLHNSNIAKTYFTTYTYYTTIFVDGETEVMSRTEVNTNIVGISSADLGVIPSARNLQIDDIVSDEDNAVIDIHPSATYDTIQRTPTVMTNHISWKEELNLEDKQLQSKKSVQELESSSSSSSSNTEKKIVPINRDRVRMIIDAKSSNSNGHYQITDNRILEDQISSESNTDEIIPSATLLLQTSFTTFTYYTTMYSSDATNVISRLETITNVVTETLQPTKTLTVDEALPITYFTTFTYWTKLLREDSLTTLSREETISNVVTPTISEWSKSSIVPSSAVDSVSNKLLSPIASPSERLSEAEYSSTTEMKEIASLEIEPTTYYTTYTYYTTSYAGNETIINSRFETVTNVIMPSSFESLDTKSQLNKNEISNMVETENNVVGALADGPPQTVSYDFKTIVDADGISTLYFTTEIIATTIDGTATVISSSTSSINIDEVKKAISTKVLPESSGSSTRTYKTGLVRLIDGTKLSNRTTTVYQSRVIGTIIDQRYAQIIESTSSFIIERTQAPAFGIYASSTLSPTLVQPTVLLSAFSDATLESSISNTQDLEKNEDHEGEESEDENEDKDEGEDDESGRPRTRLSFQTKKKTFTPVIRPFASRNRPQFAPKRKNILKSSATIITRSDLTPTITATPAIKSDSRGRFSSSRKANLGISSSGASGNGSQGGKRFGRPTKSSQFGGLSSSTSFPGSSRNRLQSSRVQISSSSYGGVVLSNSRRNGGSLRGSSTNIRSFSSAYPGNSRLRIRPSSSSLYESFLSTSSYTTLPADSAEEDGVTQRNESEEEVESSENFRKNNSNLLRFRRPQLNRPAFQPGQRSLPSSGQVAPRRNPINQKLRTTTTTSTTTTTQRPRPRAFQRPLIGQIQNRSRPQNTLFPPRRLFQPQNGDQPADEGQKAIDDFDSEKEENLSSEYETEEDGSDNEEEEEINRRRRENFAKLSEKKRSKRQTNNFRNRFRRPSTSRPAMEERAEDPTEDESSTVRSRASSRFTPRTHSLPTSSHSSSKAQHNNRAIRPTKPNSNNRAQFTLREKDTTSKHPSRITTNFRRPTPNGVSSRRTTTVASRPKAPRIKNYGNPFTETTHSSSPRGRTQSSRSRSTARSRSRSDFTTDPIIPAFDGTITVTHTTPTEITIPVVNGKVTEYKNVLTTTTSTEVVLPDQYTSIIGQLGSSTLVLNREETSLNLNGATEVTQFILHELPTTTVIFTPTTIRGRRTSFAHMVPSTAYQVENVISTMQAQIAANAPLANILLSQLLLGNLGSLNQPNINPLLALGGATQANSQNPGVPTTEYKTRSSTYVTTVTNGMSTIIPLTFHGKEILTTIFDSSSDVITATEYFTETIVVTPTQQAQQVQQVNSLLLPYLLQQQLQGQQPSQAVLQIQNSIPSQLLFSDNLQDLDHNGIQKYNDYSQDIEDYPNKEDELVESPQNTNTHGTQRTSGNSRKKGGRKFHKLHSAAAAPVIESSVITLYISGRRPGEFSTVLSTVQIGTEPSLRKRQINHPKPLLRSHMPSDYEDFYNSDGTEIKEYLLPATRDITYGHSLKSNFLSEETQSLESIVGDVGIWYNKTSALVEHSGSSKPTAIKDAPYKSSLKINLESSPEKALSSSDSKLDPNSQPKYFLV